MPVKSLGGRPGPTSQQRKSLTLDEALHNIELLIGKKPFPQDMFEVMKRNQLVDSVPIEYKHTYDNCLAQENNLRQAIESHGTGLLNEANSLCQELIGHEGPLREHLGPYAKPSERQVTILPSDYDTEREITQARLPVPISCNEPTYKIVPSTVHYCLSYENQWGEMPFLDEMLDKLPGIVMGSGQGNYADRYLWALNTRPVTGGWSAAKFSNEYARLSGHNDNYMGICQEIGRAMQKICRPMLQLSEEYHGVLDLRKQNYHVIKGMLPVGGHMVRISARGTALHSSRKELKPLMYERLDDVMQGLEMLSPVMDELGESGIVQYLWRQRAVSNLRKHS